MLALHALAGIGATGAGGDARPPGCALELSLSAAVSRASPEALAAVILEQLRAQAPVAFVEGFWVSPLDLSSALVAAGAGAGTPETLAVAAGRWPVVALVFTDASLRSAVPLPFVGDFPHLRAAAAEPPRIVVLPVAAGSDSILEYLAPEGECLYFCSDPAGWDFDQDGRPNSSDADDDEDGASDTEDAYPYWHAASVGPEEGTFYVGFTGKSSAQVSAAVLAQHRRLRGLQTASETVLLGAVAEEGALVLGPPDCFSTSADCRPLDDPAVSLVSRDPGACATLRFRCLPGQVPFSNECGCGCQPAGSREEEG